MHKKNVILKFDHPEIGEIYKEVYYEWDMDISFDDAKKRHDESQDVFTKAMFVGKRTKEEFLNQK